MHCITQYDKIKINKILHSNTIGDYLEGWNVWYLVCEAPDSSSASAQSPAQHEEHISQWNFSLEAYRHPPLLDELHLPTFFSYVCMKYSSKERWEAPLLPYCMVWYITEAWDVLANSHLIHIATGKTGVPKEPRRLYN